MRPVMAGDMAASGIAGGVATAGMAGGLFAAGGVAASRAAGGLTALRAVGGLRNSGEARTSGEERTPGEVRTSVGRRRYGWAQFLPCVRARSYLWQLGSWVPPPPQFSTASPRASWEFQVEGGAGVRQTQAGSAHGPSCDGDEKRGCLRRDTMPQPSQSMKPTGR